MTVRRRILQWLPYFATDLLWHCSEATTGADLRCLLGVCEEVVRVGPDDPTRPLCAQTYRGARELHGVPLRSAVLLTKGWCAS